MDGVCGRADSGPAAARVSQTRVTYLQSLEEVGHVHGRQGRGEGVPGAGQQERRLLLRVVGGRVGGRVLAGTGSREGWRAVNRGL